MKEILSIIERETKGKCFRSQKYSIDTEKVSTIDELKNVIELAKEKGAELVFATDPDSDRIGLAIRDDRNELVLLNGNQTGSLLTYYTLRRWNELGRINGNQYIIKTIVTTQLMGDIAESFGVRYFDVLTGFKYIGEKVYNHELAEDKTFVFGYEESYGCLISDAVRDKDGVQASMMLCEAAVYYASKGKTLLDVLDEIYAEQGFFLDALDNFAFKGIDGAEKITSLVNGLRNDPPKYSGGKRVK